MRILLITLGTQGDIRPFVALGKGLAKRGHDAAVCAPASFAGMIRDHGLKYAPMSNAIVELAQAQLGREAMASRAGRWKLVRQVGPLIRQTLEDSWAAAQQHRTQAIVYHAKALGAYHIAEKLGIPCLFALPLPAYTPTRAFTCPMLPPLRCGGWMNRLSYRLLALLPALFAGVINDWRQTTLGMPPRGRFASDLHRSDGRPVPVLYPYSEHVLPRPEDWPGHVHVTGYWFLDEAPAWSAPSELLQFLEAGPTPIYVGFGSMAGRDPAKLTRTVMEGVQRAGCRAIVAQGWGALAVSASGRDVLVIESAPHDWLFPRVAAVVHHGGAGTTAAAVRAGKPSVICPFIADQPFWGDVLYRSGIGARPIRQGKLTPDNLAAAIRTTLDGGMRQRSEAIGERVRAEDGVARGVEVVERYCGSE